MDFLSPEVRLLCWLCDNHVGVGELIFSGKNFNVRIYCLLHI